MNDVHVVMDPLADPELVAFREPEDAESYALARGLSVREIPVYGHGEARAIIEAVTA